MPSDEEWADADMGADASAGKHLARTPEEGVKDMQRRIAVLEQRLAVLTDQEDPSPTDLAQVRNDLIEARGRLTEYQIRLQGRN